MFLDGWHDHQPPIFEGSGRFVLTNSTEIHFEFDARARAQTEGLWALRRCVEEPDDRTSAMRLRGVDYSGTEWNAGWVRPRHGGVQGDYVQLFGESGALLTDVQQEEPRSGVELAYSPSPEVPFSEIMRTTAHLGDVQLGWRTSGGKHRMDVLGSVVEAMTQPWSNELWLRASTSDELRHPYLENWLSEPLRALRGQLIFPRLVARNFEDGRAAVWIRPAPSLQTSLGGCASQLRSRSPVEFWSFYERYLTYVARHRNGDGHPEFEANGLTRLHDEVIQARRAGSHWVIALCVASAIEGLVKLDREFASTQPDFSAEELRAAREMIAELKPAALRDRLKNSVSFLGQASVAKYLAQMERNGHISKAQLEAWKKVRNQVAHGNLFEPWGTRVEHERLVSLIELFYRLTSLRIGYISSRT
jgi:hypothetical protein